METQGVGFIIGIVVAICVIIGLCSWLGYEIFNLIETTGETSVVGVEVPDLVDEPVFDDAGAEPVFDDAGAEPVGYEDYGYYAVKGAGLPGNNTETVEDISLDECKSECNKKDWCKTFDYKTSDKKCYLSNTDSSTVPLKFDYKDDPYQHYHRASKGEYALIPRTAIKDNNDVSMDGTIQECKTACNDNLECKSFDFYRGQDKCDLSYTNAGEIKMNSGGDDYSYDHYGKVM